MCQSFEPERLVRLLVTSDSSSSFIKDCYYDAATKLSQYNHKEKKKKRKKETKGKKETTGCLMCVVYFLVFHVFLLHPRRLRVTVREAV